MTSDELRREIFELVGPPFDADDPEEFVSYLTAKAEADARTAAYVQWATGEMHRLADVFTAQGHAEGWLPDGYRFEVT